MNATVPPQEDDADAMLMRRPPFTIPDGTLEALKWLALATMTIDHVNAFLIPGDRPDLFAVGRIAMPLFAFVLAYNLARPDALQRGVYTRAMKRLAIYGLVAAPFYHMLVGPMGRWSLLNIMFTLLAGAAISWLVDKGDAMSRLLAVLLFAAAGAIVDYRWFGLAFYLAAWRYCKAPSGKLLAAWLLAGVFLRVVNGNSWALAAMPLIFTARHVNLRVPRIRYLFYAYYPAHLAVLLAVASGWL